MEGCGNGFEEGGTGLFGAEDADLRDCERQRGIASYLLKSKVVV